MHGTTSMRTGAALLALATFTLATSSPPAEAGKPLGRGGGRDTTPPTLVCPGDITAPASSSAGAVVTFSATATDNRDPSPRITYSHASGSTFPIATTTVTVTATDWKGNSSTCTFDVTVLAPEYDFAGTYTYPSMAWDGEENYVVWYETSITVAEDGTVTGSGSQICLYVWAQDGWSNYVLPMPEGLTATSTLTGTLSSYGAWTVDWSWAQWECWEGEFVPFLSEGEWSETRSATLDSNGDLLLYDDWGWPMTWYRQ